MKKQMSILICLMIILGLFASIFVPMQTINQIEGGFLADYQDIETANKNNTFGNFIKTELVEKEKSTSGQKNKQGEIVFKLFGFIPIKKVEVVMSNSDEYYVGGVPIGISICSDGAIVVSDELGRSSLKEGDIITHINGKEVGSLDDIQESLQECGDEVEISYLRKNKPIKTLVETTKDEASGRVKLGLWVKDDVSGIGTLTFVNKSSRQYGALGHPIVEANGGNVVKVSNGKVFSCNLIVKMLL